MCQDVLASIQPNATLSKNLSLKRGHPSVNRWTIHLIQELRNLSSLPKSALGLDSAFRVLITYMSYCAAYYEAVLYPQYNPPV